MSNMLITSVKHPTIPLFNSLNSIELFFDYLVKYLKFTILRNVRVICLLG
jgi:hypothetical protein